MERGVCHSKQCGHLEHTDADTREPGDKPAERRPAAQPRRIPGSGASGAGGGPDETDGDVLGDGHRHVLLAARRPLLALAHQHQLELGHACDAFQDPTRASDESHTVAQSRTAAGCGAADEATARRDGSEGEGG